MVLTLVRHTPGFLGYGTNKQDKGLFAMLVAATTRDINTSRNAVHCHKENDVTAQHQVTNS